MNGDLGVFAVDIGHTKEPGKGLGQDGGKSHAEHAHFKHQHEHQVQHNVHHRGDGQEDKRSLAVSKAVQNAGVKVIADGADQAHADHRQIDPGLVVGALIHPQKPQHGL